MTLQSGPSKESAWESSVPHASIVASSALAFSRRGGFCICREIVLCVEPSMFAISVCDHPFVRKSFATCCCNLPTHLSPISPSMNSLTHSTIQYYWGNMHSACFLIAGCAISEYFNPRKGGITQMWSFPRDTLLMHIKKFLSEV